ncbi:MAG: hypothetical protein RL660_2175 [Bacteroidota bacterium]|jgi:lactoylglutathione lyase
MLGLRTVIYKVPNLAEARDWYAKAFEVEAYFDEPFYVGFSIAGYELGLQPEESAIKTRADNSVAYWGVDDVASTFERFLSIGAQVHEKHEDVGGGIIVATLKDPYGNVVGLIHNPHFKLP